jgi:hypothetical protein
MLISKVKTYIATFLAIRYDAPVGQYIEFRQSVYALGL